MTALAAPISAPSPARLFVALGLVYAIWSSTYFALRVVVEDMPPFYSGGVRYALAGAILLAVQRLRGKPWPSAREWLAALPIGILLFAGGNGLVGSAERGISSGIAAVVCGTTPLWAGVVGPAFGERATGREWIGMVLGFAGVCVLGLGSDLSADPFLALLLLLAPPAWAIGSLLTRKLSVAPGPSGAATQMITGGASMLAIGAVTGERFTSLPSTESMFALAYLVVFGSLVAFSAYHYVLTNARPALAMSYAYVNPILALAIGATLGAEHVGVEVIFATALIAGAVLLIVRGKRDTVAESASKNRAAI